MKKLFSIIALALLLSSVAFGQTPYKLRYDAVQIGKDATSLLDIKGRMLLGKYNSGTTLDSVLTVNKGVVRAIPWPVFSGGPSGVSTNRFQEVVLVSPVDATRITLTTNSDNSFLMKGGNNAVMMSVTNAVIAQDTVCIGYAMEGGTTTGGAGGTVDTVSTESELRAALSGSAAKIVYFDGDISYTGVIPTETANMIDVGSNTTLIGINGGTLNGLGLAMYGKENIIIRTMRINKVREYDCITIKELTHHVWIDKCELWQDRDHGWDGYYDELMDISDRANYITISNTIFSESHIGLLVGGSDLATADEGYLKVTMYRNFFFNISERQPTARFGFFHAFNNYHLHTSGYNNGYTYGITGNGTLRTDNNYLSGQNIPFLSGYNEILAAEFSGIETNIVINSGENQLAGAPTGNWMPPYSYASSLIPAADVPAYVLLHAGPNGASGGGTGSSIYEFTLNGPVLINGTEEITGALSVGGSILASAIGLGTVPTSPLHISNAGGASTSVLVEATDPASFSSIEQKNDLGVITAIIGAGSAFDWQIYDPSNSYLTNDGGGVGLLATGVDGVITFATGGNTINKIRQRIFANGNTVFGWSEDQGAKLAVNGFFYVEGDARVLGDLQAQTFSGDLNGHASLDLKLTAGAGYPISNDLYLTNYASLILANPVNVPRWAFGLSGGEGGANSGSDVTISSYDDAGNWMNSPFKIIRATGEVSIDNLYSSGPARLASITAGVIGKVNGLTLSGDTLSFSVSPIAPTPTAGSDNTNVATTAFVKSAITTSNGATGSTYSPTFTKITNVEGTPTIVGYYATYGVSGNIVHVSIGVTIDPIVANSTAVLYFTLPPGFTSSSTSNGIITSKNFGYGTVAFQSGTQGKAELFPTGSVSQTFSIQYDYAL